MENTNVDWLYKGKRFTIRALRIICGLILACLALWTGSAALDRLSTPFAAASVMSLAAGFFYAFLTFVLVSCAFTSAFGGAPNEVTEKMRLIEEAKSRQAATLRAIEEQEQRNEGQQKRQEEQKKKNEEYRKRIASLPIWRRFILEIIVIIVTIFITTLIFGWG